MNGLTPYIGTTRPRSIMAAWFIIPFAVHLYQTVVLQQAAKRLFLEPLNHRGQPSWPFRLGARDLRRRIDAAMVAHWSVMLFGLALDGLFWIFWIILKSPEGKRFAVHSKFRLLFQLTIVAQWYLNLGMRDCNVWLTRSSKFLYICSVMFCFAELTTYGLYVVGLTLKLCLGYFILFLQVVLLSMIRLRVSSITRYHLYFILQSLIARVIGSYVLCIEI